MVDYGDGYGPVIFGQIYHTPVSIMIFRLSGVNDGDYVDLSPWLQCVYSVHFSPISDIGDVDNQASVQISGTYPNNCGPVIIFHDFDNPVPSGTIWDITVYGHKAECGSAFDNE